MQKSHVSINCVPKLAFLQDVLEVFPTKLPRNFSVDGRTICLLMTMHGNSMEGIAYKHYTWFIQFRRPERSGERE